jgi:hypothetical protein
MIIPDYFRLFPIIPDCQLTFPIIPDFSRCIGIGQELPPGVFGARGFSGRRCHAAGFALSRPCIATDNSKGEHCYYIS